MTAPLPLFLLTGFLGSGKTTLLRRLLQDPAFHDTAVIINEFGEIGLDHELIAFSGEQTVVLNGGCVCCAIREDLETALRELFEQRDRGEIPPFARVVIETTGLADPIPIIATLRSNPLASSRLNLFGTITVVDALLGAETMTRHVEAVKQAASADRLVIAKCDLARHSDIAALEHGLRQANPWAEMHRLSPFSGDAAGLFATDRHNPEVDPAQAENWVGGEHAAIEHQHHHGTDCTLAPHTHNSASYGSFSVSYGAPLDWAAFGLWLTLLLHRHGDHVLRVKGLLSVAGLDTPVLLHAVQHIVHPPMHLERWPSADRNSRIVFITHGIAPESVRRSLEVFGRLGKIAGSRSSQADYKLAGAGGMVAGHPIRRATAPRWLRG